LIHIKLSTVYTMLTQSYYLIMIKVADEAILRNYLKEDLGWILENLHLVTE